MKCVHCGAAVIAGADRCYRCTQPVHGMEPDEPGFESVATVARAPAAPAPAPVRAHAPARAPARAHRPSPTAPTPSGGALTVAAWASFALAGLGLVDLVLLRDSTLILGFVALQALVGVALLRGWRGAWGSALALAVVDGSLGLLAMMGGRLAGVLGGLCVGTLAAVGVVALAKGRAHMKRRAHAHAKDDVVVIS